MGLSGPWPDVSPVVGFWRYACQRILETQKKVKVADTAHRIRLIFYSHLVRLSPSVVVPDLQFHFVPSIWSWIAKLLNLQ